MAKPVFEHRHYKLIAAKFAEMAPVMANTHAMAREFSRMFARDNPSFDPERFEAAVNGRPINGRDKVR